MKKKVSFPSMGDGKVAFSALFDTVPGLEVFDPPSVNREIIKLGARYSPEFVCYPFKITLGEFIYMNRKYGINTFLQASDCGPCRFGFYAPVQERILKDLGNEIEIYPLFQEDLSNAKWLDLYYQLLPFGKKYFNLVDVAYTARMFFLKCMHLEYIKRVSSLVRCREKYKGDTNRITKFLLDKLRKEKNIIKLCMFKDLIKSRFRKMEIDWDYEPYRVFFTGEIHISLEDFANMDMIRKLGDLGVEVHLGNTIYDWVKYKAHINPHRTKLANIAKPFIPIDIGGEARWVMGDYITCQKEHFDGFIYVYPFTCMPENSVRGIIEGQTPDRFFLPVQYFSLDEHSGYEGLRTRIEAFLDLMQSNREHNPYFQGAYEKPKILNEIWGHGCKQERDNGNNPFRNFLINKMSKFYQVTEKFGTDEFYHVFPLYKRILKISALIISSMIFYDVGLKDIINYLTMFVRFVITGQLPNLSLS